MAALLGMLTGIAGALVCFVLRMVATYRARQLPKAKASDDDAREP